MRILSVLGLLAVAVAMALSLAHALELPGKMRLDEPTYRAVQAIYYPGFTVGGFLGEFGALVVLPILLYVTPAGTARFWWVVAAFVFLLLAHATYWVVTHPVNNVWLKDTELTGLAATFFSAFARPDADWTELRNAWEYSHVARAVFTMASLVSMSLAVTR